MGANGITHAGLSEGSGERDLGTCQLLIKQQFARSDLQAQ